MESCILFTFYEDHKLLELFVYIVVIAITMCLNKKIPVLDLKLYKNIFVKVLVIRCAWLLQ